MTMAALLGAGIAVLFSVAPLEPRGATETILSAVASQLVEEASVTGSHRATRDGLPEGWEDTVDAWGFPIRYFRVPGLGFNVISLGADGIPGGEGADADLVVYRR